MENIKLNELNELMNSLCCNGCGFFIDKICIHVDSENNVIDKSLIVNDFINRDGDFFIDFAKNIDNHFLCENYETK